MNQRTIMRQLWLENNASIDRAIERYADAELSGKAQRRSNLHGLNARQYARALLLDGLRKGWLERDHSVDQRL